MYFVQVIYFVWFPRQQIVCYSINSLMCIQVSLVAHGPLVCLESFIGIVVCVAFLNNCNVCY